MLVEDTLHFCDKLLLTKRRYDSEDLRERTYTSPFLRGKLWAAVRWITEREQGSVYQNGDI